MAFTLKVIEIAAPADTNVATLYTVPASTTFEIGAMSISNQTAAAALAHVHIVPPAGSASNANRLMPAYSVPPYSPFEGVGKGHVLTDGYTIQIKTDTANALTFFLSGGLVT